MVARSDDIYLYIDYAYLKAFADATMQQLFGFDADLDVPAMWRAMTVNRSTNFKRIFIYHCMPEQKVGESDSDYALRAAPLEQFFKKARAVRGVHIRKGTLRGDGKRVRQKEIDVLLATDMLTHGYDGNMEKGVLIAGDLDFRPLVEALVRRGVFVEVWSEAKSTSDDLHLAADFGQTLDFRDVHSWCTPEFQTRNPLPQNTGYDEATGGIYPRQAGLSGNRVLGIGHKNGGGYILKLHNPLGHQYWWHQDHEVLERFAEALYGNLQRSGRI
jgi:uncharacterized LabA/DUF88 family protein